MKLKPVKFGIVTALIWGIVVISIAIVNLIFPGYGVAFLEMMDGIYPAQIKTEREEFTNCFCAC